MSRGDQIRMSLDIKEIVVTKDVTKRRATRYQIRLLANIR